jgi:hypothetical protein
MTPRQADKLIKAGKPVRVLDAYDEEFVATFVRRNSRYIESAEGGNFAFSDLKVIALSSR